MFRHSIVLTAAALAFTSVAAQAQDKPDGQWHGNLSLGGAFSSGNSSNRSLAGTADTSNTTSSDKTSLYSLVNYARSDVAGVKTTTADLLRVGGRYDFNLSRELFAFGGAEGETNKAGGVRDRYSLNGGLGYKLIRNDSTSLDVFAGVGYTDTSFTTGPSRSGANGLLGEESSHKLNASTSFKQRFVYYPGGSSVGSRATFDAGFATAISGGWTLNTGFAARYADKVPAGVKKTDSLLTVGFGYKF